jgi:hypothetical protein
MLNGPALAICKVQRQYLREQWEAENTMNPVVQGHVTNK